jgi:hypothetical protein
MNAARVRCGLLALAISSAAAADAVSDWNQKAGVCALAAQQTAPPATRTLAIVHVAMFDAINSIEGRYAPYRFKVSAAPGSSAEAAGIGAAHAALVKLFPDQKASLDAAFAQALSRLPENGKDAGIAVGEEVAQRLLALRAGDGADAPNDYRPLTVPGVYVATTLPIVPRWGSVAPWVMQRGSQFRPPPPPQLSSPQWARDYDETRRLGGAKSTARTPDQTAMARFWIVAGPEIADPVARQLAGAPGRSLIQNARLFALLEMAVADAYIAVFDAKYAFNSWRPITAIRNGDKDGNDATAREADWEPVIDTPPHPEYPCAHCIASAAARAVLEAEFGAGAHPLSLTAERHWPTIQAFADEVSAARIFGGIHFRNSTEVAKRMGAQIGELVVQTSLKPVR